MSAKSGYKCAECGCELSSQMTSCPKCGSTKVGPYIDLVAEIQVARLTGKVRNKNNKVTTEFKKLQRLGETGKKEKVEVLIDKPKNVKHHRVEELNDKGNWVEVHSDVEHLPKKKKRI